MDTHLRGRRLPVITGLILMGLGVLLVACAPTSQPVVEPTPNSPSPEVTIVEAPVDLCQTATQLRLTLQTTENITAETPAGWELQPSSGDRVLKGTWTVRDGPVLIPLPGDQPLAPGEYTLLLTWQDEELARHLFTLYPSEPVISGLSVSLTPGGPAEEELPPELRVAYVTFRYESACAGSPFWITVWDEDGEAVCSETGMLEDRQGAGEVACYREDGATLAPGTYRIEMTLTEETRAERVITVTRPVAAAQPTAEPTAAAGPVRCGEPFAAAGITPDGEPFLTPALFDWYTEVVYVGAQCENLSEETRWQSAWYLEGVPVREAEGRWQGAAQSVVWDALTGQPENPFLAPGVYTVTLTVGDVPLTTSFSVFDYALRDTPQEGALSTPSP